MNHTEHVVAHMGQRIGQIEKVLNEQGNRVKAMTQHIQQLEQHVRKLEARLERYTATQD